MTELKAGDMAPDFDLPTDRGKVSLAGLRGKTVVLYFYPKDDTTGCTAESIAFSQAKPDFAAVNAVVVGVSKDSVKSHARFRQKHGLDVELGSSENEDMVDRYGVWVEKSMYGRKYMGIDRSTFLIDKDGRLARVWRKVSVTGHVDEVLAAAKGLAA